jgi:hypothetical protein
MAMIAALALLLAITPHALGAHEPRPRGVDRECGGETAVEWRGLLRDAVQAHHAVRSIMA